MVIFHFFSRPKRWDPCLNQSFTCVSKSASVDENLSTAIPEIYYNYLVCIKIINII